VTSVRSVTSKNLANSCYFRSSVEPPYRKALLQITERCNLYCAHCFLSAGDYGDTLPLESIKDTLIPRLKQCRVTRVTLTGGEPFVHPNIVEIVRVIGEAVSDVGICTNAATISTDQMDTLAEIGGVHINVSLDGFRPESHGKFRGNIESFAKTVETIRQLSQRRLLQGLLVTPNNLARLNEYAELCDFASRNDATYVLFNPLSNMGRGVESKSRLAPSRETMQTITEITSPFNSRVHIVHIRFPNDQFPLGRCEAGNIIYVFVHGEVAVCPYLVFAASTPQSEHRPEEFIVGNILNDPNVADKLDAYKFHERYQPGDNPTCRACSLESKCGKGCPAAVVASGQRIGEVDCEVCPIVNSIGMDENVAREDGLSTTLINVGNPHLSL
jgi:radical SAM protein with 4Fe4S-binding SPASM domain